LGPGCSGPAKSGIYLVSRHLPLVPSREDGWTIPPDFVREREESKPWLPELSLR
jgi:hypothetical protein